MIRRTFHIAVLFATLALVAVPAWAQTVTGRVTSADDNAPLPGVNIVVKGNVTVGTTTDLGGIYNLNVPSLQDTLAYSFVGYRTEEIPIDGRTTINVQMTSQMIEGEELVVIGYGQQRKTDVTGSVTSVSAEEIEALPVTDVSQALAGKVAGLQVTQNSGIPGVTPDILVRGQNSISAGTGPLIVVDGIPFSGSLNNINQNNIASISVLKDASATAIYGTRGANGVILVTTKKGRLGGAQINYSGNVGFADFAHVLEPASPEAYLEKYRWYQLQTGVPEDQLQPVPNSPGGNEYNNYQNGQTVDWMDEVSQPGYSTDHTLSIGGMEGPVNYYLSGALLKRQGILKGYQFTRKNLRANVDADVTDYLQVGTNLSYNDNNYDGGQSNLLFAEQMSPYGTVRNSDGTLTRNPVDPELLYLNPLLGLNRDRISRFKRMTAQGTAVFKPAFLGGGSTFLQGLEYRLNTAYSYAPSREATYDGRDTENTTNGEADVRSTEDTDWLIENIISYQKDFGQHHVDFTGLYSAQEFNHFWTRANAVGFVNDLLSFNNLNAGSNKSTWSDKRSSSLLSQMARVNYSYRNTYLLTLTARRDGYSAFGSNTSKYAVFPSAAIGWNISNEPFMQGVEFVNDLKIRFSYGESGNQAINPYQTITTNSTVLYPFNGQSTVGAVPNVLGNANLQWETSTTANLGFDFGILRNRIRGSVDLYNSTSKNLLLRRNLPRTTGYSSVWENIGEVNNKGIEVALNTINVQSGDFSWTSDITFATNHNEIVDLYGDKQDDVGNRWFIGEPIRVIYDYEMLGVWQTDEAEQAAVFNAEPGDLKFADLNGDNNITSEDRTILGSPDPKWTGGINNTFYYKNFTLRVFVQTVQGVLRNNGVLNWLDLAGRRNIPADLTYWTEENGNNEMPALSFVNTQGYGYPRDASFVRLRDVTLGYTLPQRLVDKIGVRQLRLYVSGTNLHTWTDWLDWDPEYSFVPRGGNGFQTNYPLERTVVFGIDLGL